MGNKLISNLGGESKTDAFAKNKKMNRRNFLGTGLTATGALTFGNSWAKDGFCQTRLLSSINSTLREGILDKNVFAEGWKMRYVCPGEFTVSGINNTGDWFDLHTVPAMPHAILLYR